MWRYFLLLATVLILLSSARSQAQERSQSRTASAGESGPSVPPYANTESAGGREASAVRPAVPGWENHKLREEIQSTLRNEPSLAGSQLSVEVTDSEIILSGSASSEHDRQTARRLAQSYGNNRRVVDAKVGLNGKAEASAQAQR